MGLYPSIPDEAGLKALFEKLEQRADKKISSTDLAEMAEFILKNNFFEFETKTILQISGAATGTKFVPPYACLFIYSIVNDFVDSEIVKPCLWLRFIDDIFFIWTEGEDKS